MKLGRLRSDHLAHDFPGYPKLAANRLDRLLLGEIRPTDLRDRLHYQHPQPGPHVPMEATVDPLPPGSRLDADHPENGVLIPCLFTTFATVGCLAVRGRDVRRRTPPAQIRTSGFPASGSYLGCLTAK